MTTKEIVYMEDSFAVQWILDETPPPNRNVMGYGSKIPTQYRIKCADGHTRRVYMIQYSNSGSAYINVGCESQYIHDWQVPERTEMAVGA